MLKGGVADEFEALVPVGMRSKLVNEALSKELARLRKQQATDKLRRLKKKMPAVSTREIVSDVRADRERSIGYNTNNMSFLTLIRGREQKRAALREDAIKEVRRLAEHLKKLYPFEAIYICGSLAAGTFGRHSDIDLVIKGMKVVDFFKAYAYLIKECAFEIDLKPFEDLDEDFRKRVQSGGIRLG